MTTPAQNSPKTSLVKSDFAGEWRLFAKPPGGVPLDVTYFRGVPTDLLQMSNTDPFGPQQLSIRFPAISIYDRVGQGELDWLDKGTDFDLEWVGTLPAGYQGTSFAWEGYAVSFEYSSALGLEVQCTGAMLALDNYLAKPEYPARPIPYEWAMHRQLVGREDTHLQGLRIEFPQWWDTIYKAPPKVTPEYLIPTGVSDGDKWTGLVTRSTGSWEPVLTSYFQTMLSSMYTERGRWTLDLNRRRQPVLLHRDILLEPAAGTLVIDPVTPGVSVSLSVDWSQSTNVVYGQGQSFSGESFSGMRVSGDGRITTYDPLSWLRQVHPPEDRNGWLDRNRMRKEIYLQLQQGLGINQAKVVATAHLGRFADPGVTGTVTLQVDPKIGAVYCPRALIKAGMVIHLPHVFGAPEGVLLHIASATYDFTSQTMTLSVDSKYRDQLTVDEVKARGRDSLSINRMLIGGQYSPPIPDQLIPWNYAEGSGYIPSGPQYNSRRLFQDMPADVDFPWEEWTTQRPPGNKDWQKCYIGLRGKQSNSTLNWATVHDRQGNRFGHPIKMAQAGSIRLLQIAAYDKTGKVLKVPFHVSLYYAAGVNPDAMPALTAEDAAKYPPYQALQTYPFFPGAWENYKLDGTRIRDERPVSVATAGLVRAWGTGVVKAGYWPGASNMGDSPTGLLNDEGIWEFDTTSFDNSFDPYSTNQSKTMSGNLYAMIYCEDQGPEPVYFLGRMFRVEPGTGQ